MNQALAELLPEASAEPACGGTSFWMKGPPGLVAQRLADVALSRGLVIEPGKDLFYGSNRPTQFFRLDFSSIPTDRIRPGIEILGKTLRELL